MSGQQAHDCREEKPATVLDWIPDQTKCVIAIATVIGVLALTLFALIVEELDEGNANYGFSKRSTTCCSPCPAVLKSCCPMASSLLACSRLGQPWRRAKPRSPGRIILWVAVDLGLALP